VKARTWIGLGAGVLLLGVAVDLLERRPPAGAGEGGAMFPGFDRDKAQKIEVKGKLEESILLQKAAQGWVVPAEGSYSAEPEGVREILDFVANVHASSKVSENPGKRALFQVDASGLSVKISGAEEAVLAGFVIGKTGPDFMSTYVRPESADSVYLVDQSLRRIFVRPGARQWRDKAIFRLSGADITRLKWKREGKDVALESSPGGDWTLTAPAATPARRDEVEALRNALATLQSDDFVDAQAAKDAGFDSPYAHLEFALRDGTSYALDVGKENDRSQRHVRRSGNDTIFLVNNFRVNTIFKSADDLKTPPPEAAAAPTPKSVPQSAAPAPPAPAAPPAGKARPAPRSSPKPKP
jgi:hypothetical protein